MPTVYHTESPCHQRIHLVARGLAKQRPPASVNLHLQGSSRRWREEPRDFDVLLLLVLALLNRFQSQIPPKVLAPPHLLEQGCSADRRRFHRRRAAVLSHLHRLRRQNWRTRRRWRRRKWRTQRHSVAGAAAAAAAAGAGSCCCCCRRRRPTSLWHRCCDCWCFCSCLPFAGGSLRHLPGQERGKELGANGARTTGRQGTGARGDRLRRAGPGLRR